MARHDDWRPSADTRLAYCLDWSFRLKCGACDHFVEHRVETIAAEYGGHRTVAEIVARLRCGVCSRAPVDVQLTLTDQTGATKAVRLQV
jgi:hypothetical protein